MVAVGTLIAERPPHGSRCALLTHRAPPSGQTFGEGGFEALGARRTASIRIDVVTSAQGPNHAACRLFPLGEGEPSTLQQTA
jgi:hypothetical protein